MDKFSFSDIINFNRGDFFFESSGYGTLLAVVVGAPIVTANDLGNVVDFDARVLYCPEGDGSKIEYRFTDTHMHYCPSIYNYVAYSGNDWFNMPIAAVLTHVKRLLES